MGPCFGPARNAPFPAERPMRRRALTEKGVIGPQADRSSRRAIIERAGKRSGRGKEERAEPLRFGSVAGEKHYKL